MGTFKLTISVPNITEVYSLYNKISVARSESGEGGPYYDITTAAKAAASLTSSNDAPFTLNGLDLTLKINNGAEQTIDFITADPIQIDDLVDLVNDQASGFVASEDAGKLALTTVVTGTEAVIEITGGTSLTELGFTASQRDTGEDQYISLSPSQSEYEFLDQSGDADYWYKTKYYSTVTGFSSSWSDPVQAESGGVIPSSSLILCTVDLAALDGAPVDERVVSIYNNYVPMTSDGYLIAGKEVKLLTDALGHAQTYLIRGSEVSVSIAGTSVVRNITVPTSGSEFSITDAIAAADDLFQIHEEDIPAAVRRS